MDKILVWIDWLKNNYVPILVLIGSLVLLAEAIVRFTPTKKDDGFVKRLGNLIDRIFNLVHFPNIHSVEFQNHIKAKNAEVPKQP